MGGPILWKQSCVISALKLFKLDVADDSVNGPVDFGRSQQIVAFGGDFRRPTDHQWELNRVKPPPAFVAFAATTTTTTLSVDRRIVNL